MRTYDLQCVSCQWVLRTRDAKKAEREAARHTAENNHCVVDNVKED